MIDDLDHKIGLLYQIKDETNHFKLANLFADYFNTPHITKEQYLQSTKKYVIDRLKDDALKALKRVEDILYEK